MLKINSKSDLQVIKAGLIEQNLNCQYSLAE